MNANLHSKPVHSLHFLFFCGDTSNTLTLNLSCDLNLNTNAGAALLFSFLLFASIRQASLLKLLSLLSF